MTWDEGFQNRGLSGTQCKMGEGGFVEMQMIGGRPPKEVCREVPEIRLVADQQHGVRRQVPADPGHPLDGGHPGKRPVAGGDGEAKRRRNRSCRFKGAQGGAAEQEGWADAGAAQKICDQGGLLVPLLRKGALVISRGVIEGVRVAKQ